MQLNSKSVLLFFIATALSLGLISSPSRSLIHSLFVKKERTILAVVDLQAGGNRFRAIKLSKKGELFIEIYNTNKEQPHLEAVFPLQGSVDVYYDLNKRITNLFLVDVDQDKNLDIIVPVLDGNLTASLDVIKYDHDQKSFQYFD